jgi:hypothetical protein
MLLLEENGIILPPPGEPIPDALVNVGTKDKPIMITMRFDVDPRLKPTRCYLGSARAATSAPAPPVTPTTTTSYDSFDNLPSDQVDEVDEEDLRTDIPPGPWMSGYNPHD